MPTEFTTPPGRIVYGHPAKSRTKTDQKTRQPVLKDGQPVQQWAFGVAYDKATFQAHIWPALAAEAAAGYPQGVPPAFSWKYKDGDGVDREGKPYNLREGYAGCYVLSISSELMAPPLFKFNGTGYDQLPPEAVKCGDYVAVGLNLKVNVPADRTHTPGLYVNPTIVEFVGYGTEIQSQGTVDPMTALGGRQHQLPPGASATPMQTPGAPGMPGAPPSTPMQPQPGPGAPMTMPGTPPAPMQPPQPVYAPQPPAPVYAPQPPAPPPQPVGPQRPTDPAYIHLAGQPGEMWHINGAWIPAQAAPPLPPPAPDFVHNAGMPMQPQMPGMPGPR